MAKLFSWINPDGGAFSDQNNWQQSPENGIVGYPGSTDAAYFGVGGTYTVTMGGITVGTISATDTVTFSGNFTATRGVGGDVMTLLGGKVFTDPSQGGSVYANTLTMSQESATGGGVSAPTLKVSSSSFNLSGQNGGYLVGSTAANITNSTARVTYFEVDGTGTVSGTQFTIYDDGSGATDLGTFRVAGRYTLGSDSVKTLAADLIGVVKWTGGSLDASTFTSGRDTSGNGAITFDGTVLATHKVSDESGSSDPTSLDLIGAAWTNSGDFSSSGSLALANGASLTTGSFSADPQRGVGAAVSVSSPTAKLTDKGSYTSATLRVTAGGDVEIDRNASLAAPTGNVVSGAGSALAVKGALSLTGTAGKVSLLIGANAFVSTGSATLHGATVAVSGATWSVSKTLDLASGGHDVVEIKTGGALNTGSAVFDGGVLDVHGGTATVSGALKLTSGAHLSVEASGRLLIEGAASGTGSFAIGSGATLEFDAGAAAAETVAFSGTKDVLLLKDAAAFKATVVDFTAKQTIDLADLSPSGAKVSYAPNGTNTGGTLVVKNATERAVLHLDGQFIASAFHVKSDGHVGTAVTYVRLQSEAQLALPSS